MGISQPPGIKDDIPPGFRKRFGSPPPNQNEDILPGLGIKFGSPPPSEDKLPKNQPGGSPPNPNEVTSTTPPNPNQITSITPPNPNQVTPTPTPTPNPVTPTTTNPIQVTPTTPKPNQVTPTTPKPNQVTPTPTPTPNPIQVTLTPTPNPIQVTPTPTPTPNPIQVTLTPTPNQVTPTPTPTPNPIQVTPTTPTPNPVTPTTTTPNPVTPTTTNPIQVTPKTPKPNQVTPTPTPTPPTPNPIPSSRQSTSKKEKVYRKCSKRYERRLTGFSPQDKEQYIEGLSENLSNPAWIAEELFKNDQKIILKLLLVPVAPSIFAQITKITGSSFGYLHTALQVNNKVVDWDQSGLIVPRPFSSTVHTALDIASADTHRFQKTPEMVKKVSELIAVWNKEYSYNFLTRNCQHFVNEFVEQLGIKFEWNENIVTYLSEIKDDPQNVSPHIYYEKDGKRVKVVFENHEQLDTFCIGLRSEDPDQYSSLQKLLKAFDRGFWFRDRAANPEKYEIPKTCPFNLPTAYKEDDFKGEMLYGENKEK